MANFENIVDLLRREPIIDKQGRKTLRFAQLLSNIVEVAGSAEVAQAVSQDVELAALISDHENRLRAGGL